MDIVFWKAVGRISSGLSMAIASAAAIHIVSQRQKPNVRCVMTAAPQDLWGPMAGATAAASHKAKKRPRPNVPSVRAAAYPDL